MRAAAAVAWTGAALTLLNALTAPRVRARNARSTGDSITVCIPARNEETTLPLLLNDLLAQRSSDPIRVLVLDDESTDDTARAAAAVLARATTGAVRDTSVLTSADIPVVVAEGAIGKSVACIRLGEFALRGEASILVFLDADVRLEPDAISAAVAVLRSTDAALLSPWPWQVAKSVPEKIVQPILCWSWSCTLWIRGANAGTRASTTVANGQFLVADADAYRSIGGHRATERAIIDDLALARAFRAAGHRTMVAYAGEVASCRMYSTATQVRVGYTRWLWSAFGSTAGTVVVLSVALAVYVGAPFALVRGPRTGSAALAVLGTVVSRVCARRCEGGREHPGITVASALAHPIAIVAAVTLAAESARGHRRGTLTWKDRRLA